MSPSTATLLLLYVTLVSRADSVQTSRRQPWTPTEPLKSSNESPAYPAALQGEESNGETIQHYSLTHATQPLLLPTPGNSSPFNGSAAYSPPDLTLNSRPVVYTPPHVTFHPPQIIISESGVVFTDPQTTYSHDMPPQGPQGSLLAYQQVQLTPNSNTAQQNVQVSYPRLPPPAPQGYLQGYQRQGYPQPPPQRPQYTQQRPQGDLYIPRGQYSQRVQKRSNGISGGRMRLKRGHPSPPPQEPATPTGRWPISTLTLST